MTIAGGRVGFSDGQSHAWSKTGRACGNLPQRSFSQFETRAAKGTAMSGFGDAQPAITIEGNKE